MKSRVPHVIAALLAAGAVPLALAQASPPAGATQLPQPPANLVAEPVASASRAEGPDADLAKAIVDALNADPALKHAKITVVPDTEGPIFLTGVTLTRAQTKRAVEIATSQAGEGKVANAIQNSELVIDQGTEQPRPPVEQG